MTASSCWHAVHGDRLGQDLNTLYVNENRVDAYVEAVSNRYGTWLPAAPIAATGVTVTVSGQPVAVAADGSFAADVPLPAGGIVDVVATDRSGGTTGLHLSAAGP